MGGLRRTVGRILPSEQRRTVLALVCSVCILSAGCTVQQSSTASDTPMTESTPTESPTPAPTSTPTLESRGTVSDNLLTFVHADNKSQAAESQGLEYRPDNQTVAVRVRPTAKQSVPTAYFSAVEYRFSDGRISGWVNASAIQALGRSERVAFIRASPTVEQSSYDNA